MPSAIVGRNSSMAQGDLDGDGKPDVFTGGVRAQAQLIETLSSTMSRLARCAQIVIGEVHKKILDGRLTDEATLKFAPGAIRDFARESG